MTAPARAPLTAAQLRRKACVYVRQSSDFQVRHHVERQRLQYALADHARQLGFRETYPTGAAKCDLPPRSPRYDCDGPELLSCCCPLDKSGPVALGFRLRRPCGCNHVPRIASKTLPIMDSPPAASTNSPFPAEASCRRNWSAACLSAAFWVKFALTVDTNWPSVAENDRAVWIAEDTLSG